MTGQATDGGVDGTEAGSGTVGCAAPTVSRGGGPSRVKQPPTLRWKNPATTI